MANPNNYPYEATLDLPNRSLLAHDQFMLRDNELLSPNQNVGQFDSNFSAEDTTSDEYLKKMQNLTATYEFNRRLVQDKKEHEKKYSLRPEYDVGDYDNIYPKYFVPNGYKRCLEFSYEKKLAFFAQSQARVFVFILMIMLICFGVVCGVSHVAFSLSLKKYESVVDIFLGILQSFLTLVMILKASQKASQIERLKIMVKIAIGVIVEIIFLVFDVSILATYIPIIQFFVNTSYDAKNELKIAGTIILSILKFLLVGIVAIATFLRFFLYYNLFFKLITWILKYQVIKVKEYFEIRDRTSLVYFINLMSSTDRGFHFSTKVDPVILDATQVTTNNSDGICEIFDVTETSNGKNRTVSPRTDWCVRENIHYVKEYHSLHFVKTNSEKRSLQDHIGDVERHIYRIIDNGEEILDKKYGHVFDMQLKDVIVTKSKRGFKQLQ